MLVRLHKGNELLGLPVHLPRDPAIPAAEVSARARFTRAFVRDAELLRREEVGAPRGIEAVAYLVLLAIAGTWLGALTWGLRRMGRGASAAHAHPHARERPSGAPAAGQLRL